MRREPQNPITQALLTFFKTFCFEPDEIEVIESLDGSILDLTFQPNTRDLKILIGKKGKMILALRHVAERMGAQMGLKVRLEVRDSFKGQLGDQKPFSFNPAFTPEMMLPVLTPMLAMLYKTAPGVAFEDHDEKVYVVFDVPRDDLTLIKALGAVFYPYGYRNGRKLSFRVLDYHPEETENAEANT